MKDDYLWDGSGEPDPDVERLEQVLGRYRYQAKPVSPALSSQLSWQRRTTMGVGVRVAAAAAVILMLLAGLWIFRVQQKSVTTPPGLRAKDNTSEQPIAPPKEANPDAISSPRETARVKVAQRSRRKSHHQAFPKLELPPDRNLGVDSGLVAQRQPIMIPFIDVETARHLEQAQLLLRSFRNTRDADASTDSDLAYDKQRSRGLLYRNILLRRDAEARGNLPAENLLGTLEPFLLDIANLPDRPTTDDVLPIKERMQRNEIVSALQIYSAPILSRLF